MDQTSRDFLYRYLNNTAPTGFEKSGQDIWLEYLKPYIDDTITDAYGTAVGVINPGKDYKVVLEAHADEISWWVHYITDDGYIYVQRNGGSDTMIAPSMRVNIHTDKGTVPGVFGWPAIHVRNRQKEKTPSLENICIDCGCESKEEVEEMGIHVGCVVTFADELTELNDKFVTGRALDNRIGGFMIAEVARRLRQNKDEIDYTLYIVNSVQEEVGLNGARMIAERLKPDVALVTDVTHDTYSPQYNKIKQGDTKCGRGPSVTYAPAVHNNVLKFLLACAKEKDIAIQRQVSARATGTDTDAFAFSNMGVPSSLVSLPLKYMHTTVEMAHKDDIERVIQLMHAFASKIKAGHNFSYFA